MSDASRRREPCELLQEIHAALDLVEKNLNLLPWRGDTGSHIDLVVQLRNRVISTYPHDMTDPAGVGPACARAARPEPNGGAP